MNSRRCPCNECGAIHHYTPAECQRCGAPWGGDPEPFRLKSEPAERKTFKRAEIEADPVHDTKRLFPGSHSCLPDQLDLFGE